MVDDSVSDFRRLLDDDDEDDDEDEDEVTGVYAPVREDECRGMVGVPLPLSLLERERFFRPLLVTLKLPLRFLLLLLLLLLAPLPLP